MRRASILASTRNGILDICHVPPSRTEIATVISVFAVVLLFELEVGQVSSRCDRLESHVNGFLVVFGVEVAAVHFE